MNTKRLGGMATGYVGRRGDLTLSECVSCQVLDAFDPEGATMAVACTYLRLCWCGSKHLIGSCCLLRARAPVQLQNHTYLPALAMYDGPHAPVTCHPSGVDHLSP